VPGGGEEKLISGAAGSYSRLSKLSAVGDNLVLHHMPQAALGFTSRADGGALAVTTGEHVLTRTYGYAGKLTREAEAGMSFRTVLARDILDMRRIVGSRYNEGMLDLLKYYRNNFPSL